MDKLSPKRYGGAIMTFCKLIIAAVTVYAFLYLILNYYPETDFKFKGFFVWVFLYGIIYLVLSSSYNCFQIGTLRLREILFAYLVVLFLVNFIMYFVLCLAAKMLLIIWPITITAAVQWAVGALLYAAADRIYFRLYPSRSAVVVCSDDLHELPVFGKLAAAKERYVVCAVCCESDGIDAIGETVAKYSTVFVGEVNRQLRIELTDLCFESNKRLIVMPTIGDIIFHNAHETFIGDSLMYQCRDRALTLEQMMVKRLMDILISLLGIVITSPLMLLSVIVIKAQDGGPVLFRQQRYTRNLETFTLLKFRSMVVDAERNGPQLTVPNDPRVTPYGRFMRRTRIDELPQFFNILRGEMSLVGPRAERIENVDYYLELMPEFRYRMKVKAGLTGYAQIYGKYNTTFEDKLKMDMLYIENCSLIRDLQLLFLTVRILFTRESTEGFGAETLEQMARAPREDKGA
ncbi:MAG: sugar transferase [Clostridia bacterium]|nr:sugar transferase [Clostridia bacterium]